MKTILNLSVTALFTTACYTLRPNHSNTAGTQFICNQVKKNEAAVKIKSSKTHSKKMDLYVNQGSSGWLVSVFNTQYQPDTWTMNYNLKDFKCNRRYTYTFKHP